ncbi:MAG: 50S ribosomal protein L1 [Nitrospinota bacterium]|nr:50S ribosomal protein L1 [Nitrospinota bacterium]
MSKIGKRLKATDSKFDREKKYALLAALSLVKETATAKFDESVEIAIRLGVNPTKADQMLRGAVSMPKGLGKSKRVVVVAKGDKAIEAKDAGADEVGAEDLVAKIQGGWLDFDSLVTTPDMMGQVGKLGKMLGPRGLMPNPKSGTVTFDLGRTINEIKAGKVEFRTDKGGVVHAAVGRASFSAEDLYENAMELVDQLLRMKPATVKGTYMRSVTVSSTMGPGVRVEIANIGTRATTAA